MARIFCVGEADAEKMCIAKIGDPGQQAVDAPAGRHPFGAMIEMKPESVAIAVSEALSERALAAFAPQKLGCLDRAIMSDSLGGSKSGDEAKACIGALSLYLEYGTE